MSFVSNLREISDFRGFSELGIYEGSQADSLLNFFIKMDFARNKSLQRKQMFQGADICPMLLFPNSGRNY